MVDRLTNLIIIFENPSLDFSKNRAENDDILGDAYEYLMRHFATQSGKSKGQFYTPSEVSRVMAKVIGIGSANAIGSTTAYDPTCGSGSLLLKVADEAGVHITLEGQEKDVSTAGLARMNMILHSFPTASILAGNTLSNPKFKDENVDSRLRTYDYVVANPPFSDKTWTTGLTPADDPYQRFTWGVPPNKQGDYAYLLHIIRSMKAEGKGACILPHGVLFRGNAEAAIRKQLINSRYLKGIIGLPANLFYGTGIPACILVLDKKDADSRTGVFIIDASKGFEKDGNKNRLRAKDIHRIVDTFNRQDESDPSYARLVPWSEIKDLKNDYNLNLPRYIDSSQREDIQDIEAHLHGGIPAADIDALNDFWTVLPSLRHDLVAPSDRAGYVLLQVAASEVKSRIYEHAEFADFITVCNKLYKKWAKSNKAQMIEFKQHDHPKHLIHALAEDLLKSFRKAPLVDAYDVYQHMMEYWDQTMQDDCYTIAADGWVAKPEDIYEVVKSGAKKGERRYKGWACDLVPKSLIVAKYFKSEQKAIDKLSTKLSSVESELEELQEEHSGDDGVLNGVSTKGDLDTAHTDAVVAIWSDEDPKASGKYATLVDSIKELGQQLSQLGELDYFTECRTRGGSIGIGKVNDRLKQLESGTEFEKLTEYVELDKKVKAESKSAEKLLEAARDKIIDRLDEDPLPDGYADLSVVSCYISLLEQQSEFRGKIREAEAKLDELVYQKYSDLTEDDVKGLVIDDKWLITLEQLVHSEMERVSHSLAGRVKELAERYETPMPVLLERSSELENRVNRHLERMGFSV